MAASFFVEAHFRFGRGGCIGNSPLTGSMQNELMTRSACVFWQNSFTDGFSCACLVDAVCQKTSLTGPVIVSH